MPHARAERPTSSFQLCGHRELGANRTPGGCGSDRLGVPWTRGSMTQPSEGHTHHSPCPPIGSLWPLPSRAWPVCPSPGVSPIRGGRKRDGKKEPCALLRPVRFCPEGTLGQVRGQLWCSHWGRFWPLPHSAQHGPTERDPPRPPRRWHQCDWTDPEDMTPGERSWTHSADTSRAGTSTHRKWTQSWGLGGCSGTG